MCETVFLCGETFAAIQRGILKKNEKSIHCYQSCMSDCVDTTEEIAFYHWNPISNGAQKREKRRHVSLLRKIKKINISACGKLLSQVPGVNTVLMCEKWLFKLETEEKRLLKLCIVLSSVVWRGPIQYTRCLYLRKQLILSGHIILFLNLLWLLKCD